MKFSRKLLGKRVRRHINIKSASLEHACLQSLTKVLDSPCHRFLRKVIPDHLQSCVTLLDCWWLTVVFILSTRLQNCNADYLRYQFNYETCRSRYLTNAMVLSFNRMALQLIAHEKQDCMVTRYCNDFIAKHEWPSNSPDINLLDYHVWSAMMKAYYKLIITSWTSKPSTINLLQTRKLIFRHLSYYHWNHNSRTS